MSQAALKEMIGQKEAELKGARATIDMWNKGSKTLEDILGSQHMNCDKSGMDYGNATVQKGQAFTSHDIKTQTKKKLKVQRGDPSIH